VVVDLPFQGSIGTAPGARPVPYVAGGSLRRAANALHRRGFRVAIRGSGRVVRTTPAAGQSAAFGSTVTVWAE
jgi:beta-lactam-binding protein with PASTA domain